ncbi:MAG: HDOD domain-containing protein [Mariprofundales bacterium]|nr:HDOD domain-containing protein [Mariprofundales bacterium]
MQEVFVGRQPIFDHNFKVIAYELLARMPGEKQHANAAVETAQVLVHSLMDIGLDKLSGHHKVHIDATGSFLIDDLLEQLPPDTVSFELLSGTPITGELLDGIKKLKSQGYTIVLDDYINSSQLAAAIELADVVKLHYAISHHCLKEELQQIRKYPVKLLIDGVDRHEIFEECKALNFDFYQGQFFCQPDLIKGKSLPENKMAVLRALQKVMGAEAIDEIEDVVKQDVALSYRLLKHINSAAFGMKREITSIGQALTLLGLKNIRRWLSLLSLASLGENKPSELIKISLLRGRALELVADYLQLKNRADYFVLGMFSVLDALLDRPMREAVEDIALPQAVRDGLLDAKSDMGKLLNLIRFVEYNEWQQVEAMCLIMPDFDAHQMMQCYLQAIHWADEQMQSLGM